MSLAHERTLGLALITAIVAVPSAAFAAKPLDPGTTDNAKKDVTEVLPAPAPVQEQAPKAEPFRPVKVEDSKPVTPGTVKRLPTTTTTSPSSGSTGTTTTAGTQRSSTRRRSSSAGSTRSQVRGNRGGATRGRDRADEVRELNAEERAERRKEAAAAAERRRAARRARREREHREAVSPALSPDRDDHRGGFVLSRAAEDVVEVIPGAILLAMTGLGALVMLLVARSWVTERRRGRALTESYAVTVQALATAIEAKDHTTGGHIERVRDLGLLLARELGARDTRDPQMAYGFLLHDVGKLAVPDSVLRHPGALSDEARAVMRRHPDEGVRILKEIPFLDRALDVVRHHHERWDGTGYPEGLAGEEIPLWARIFAVVDALDAMTADRPYRAAMSYEDALAEIRRHAGTQFDPNVVDTLEAIDPDAVTCLLEPAQKCDKAASEDTLEPLEAMLAAAGRGRSVPVGANGNGNGVAKNGNGVPLSELSGGRPAERSNTPV